MNNDAKKKAKNDLEKDFFKLMNNAVFGKTIEMLEKTEILNLSEQRKKKKLFGVRTALSYYKVFHRKFISNKNEKKTEIIMNRPVYLGLSILELSKILMYEFWYGYVKPKYGEKAKLCYMDTDSSIVYIKTNDISKDIEQNMLKLDLILQI